MGKLRVVYKKSKGKGKKKEPEYLLEDCFRVADHDGVKWVPCRPLRWYGTDRDHWALSRKERIPVEVDWRERHPEAAKMFDKMGVVAPAPLEE